MPNEINQSRNGSYCIITLYNSHHGNRKENSGFQGLEEGGNGECFYGIGFQVLQDKRVLEIVCTTV